MQDFAIGSTLAVMLAIVIIGVLIVLAPLFIWINVKKLRK